MNYCIQIWRPHLQKYTSLLEKVQRRATRMVDAVRSYSYENRLQYLRLTMLETRRLGEDLIEVFTVFKGFDDVCLNELFKFRLNSLHCNDYKIFTARFLTDCGKYAFAKRVINKWIY